MSKLYLFIFAVVISHFTQAQINKGSYLIGGQLSFSNTKTESGSVEQSSTGGAFGLSVGKAFKQNNAAGLFVRYSPSKQENFYNGIDTFNTKTNQFDIGAFYRYYKVILKDFYFFAGIEAAYTTSVQKYNYKSSTDGYEYDRNGAYLSVTPGLSYSVFKKLQIELTFPNIVSVGYFVTKLNNRTTPASDFKTRDFSAYSSLSSGSQQGWLGIGFRFVI